MYERLFEKILVSADDDEDQGDSGSLQGPPKRSRPTLPTRALASSRASGTSSEEGEPGDDSGVEPKPPKGAEPADGSNAGSDTSSNVEATRGGKSSRVSAREARSKRRQAKIDEDVKEVVPPTGAKRRPPVAPVNPKKRKAGEPGEGDDVVKVKLLTGTLYLYRGRDRRVEFVRRV